MRAEVEEIIELVDIPSASGIEIYKDKIYIIGDDTPYLFELNKKLQIIQKIPLLDSEINGNGRIKKSKKPDLESLTVVSNDNKEFLLVLGSGSFREVRDYGFIVDLPNCSVTEFSVVRFYDHLRLLFDKLHAGVLNIEATVFYNDHLYLFHRGNISGINLIVSLTWNDFIDFNRAGVAPSLQYYEIGLPGISGIPSGFSGAALIPGTSTILFTASVEDTLNEIDDGPALGSFVGSMNALLNMIEPTTELLEFNGCMLTSKVESIIVVTQSGDSTFSALACCDEDGKASSLLKLRVTLD
jgi:hypothetical protein